MGLKYRVLSSSPPIGGLLPLRRYVVQRAGVALLQLPVVEGYLGATALVYLGSGVVQEGVHHR